MLLPRSLSLPLLCSLVLADPAPAQGPWSLVDLPDNHPEVFALTTHGSGQLFIGTGGLPGSAADAIGILYSADHGNRVEARDEGLGDSRFDRLVRALHSSNGHVVAASADGTYFSEDDGASWEKRADGLPVVRQTGKRSANALTSLDGEIFCGTPAGVYKTADQGRSWGRASDGLATTDVRALTRLDNLLFASTDGDGVYRSADAGNSWIASSHGIPPGLRSRAILAHDGILLAGTTQGTYRSADQGKTWQPALANTNARSFAATGGLIALGAFRGSGIIYISNDRGESWIDVTGNLPRGGIGVWALAFDDEHLFAAVNRQGLWRVALQDLAAMQQTGAVVAQTGGRATTRRTEGAPDPLMAALDSNRDGALSAAELDQAPAALRSLDTNKDGRLSAAELGRPTNTTQPSANNPGPQPRNRQRTGQGNASGVAATLRGFDTNGDGKLTKNEVPARMQRIFDRADSNRDDVLDQQEIERFTRQLGPGRGR